MAGKILLAAALSFALEASASPVQRRRAPAGVPSYALDYAPIVYLYDADPYRPSDIAAQLANTSPEVNFTAITNGPHPLSLDNLNQLNALGDNGGTDVYLTSKTPPYQNPSYLKGVTPDSSGKTNGATTAAVIVNDHGNGLVDVFYHYFYAFNYGGSYVGFVVDDHVGDWEHNMIRFSNGKPQAVWFSQHSNGEAFTYSCLNKYNGGLRPVVFSANGSHANYAITGTHDHTIPDFNLPKGPLEDHTDSGPVWDPIASAYFYSYDANSQTFTAYDNSTPVNWLYFTGGWGDQQYPSSNSHQFCLFGVSALCKYSSGPDGPAFKSLNRTNVCPDGGPPCVVRPVLGP